MIKSNVNLPIPEENFLISNLKTIENSETYRKVFHELPALNFSEIRLGKIFAKAAKLSQGLDPYVSVLGYKHGKLVANDLEVGAILEKLIRDKSPISKLREANYSIKISCLQSLDPELKQFCLNLSQALNWDYCLNVNMYITPGLDKNCFNFHSDPYVSMIYQLLGKKEWIFPVLKNQLVRSFNPQLPLPEFEENQNIPEIILPKEWMFIPVGAVHRARMVDDELSIHLTFAFHSHKTHDGLFSALTNSLKELLNVPQQKHKVISNEEHSRLIQEIKVQFDKLDHETLLELNRKENMNFFKNGHPMNRRP